MRQTVQNRMYDLLGFENVDDRPRQETIVFLTLPHHRRSQDLDDSDALANDYDCEVNNAISLISSIDASKLTITNEQKQRFHKAMAFFRLTPKIRRVHILGEHDANGAILSKEQKASGARAGVVGNIRQRLDNKVLGKLERLPSVSISTLMNASLTFCRT